ncbi:MAG: hypothetical protein A3I66_11650 [Burkholderiales bacterium RIFCSPLOWO2_02_FULL_57_36]|nr:MAG: hypothetical protein A3I66_11650 [Burkholderiales bacterium RIFCSPLOWO2_02_FULL_57_36]
MSQPKRISPAQALAAVTKKWISHHASWLIGALDAPSWPQTFSLHKLTEKDVLADLPGTREWVNSWRNRDAADGAVEWAPRRWSSGDQELPSRLVLANPEEMARLLGCGKVWGRARERYADWSTRFPRLSGSGALARVCDQVLIGYDDADFVRLTALLQWLVDNPNSGLYLRQLPVVGVHTKWIWPRRGVVQDLMRQILDRTEGGGFHELWGLRAEPARLRMRVLCPRLRAAVGGLCDIEAPVMELAALQLAPTISLVVENLNTGIALPDIDGTVVFMGLGVAVEQLDAIGWLRGAKRHVYWGDIDTHGFAILARARRRFPQTVSVLMDEGTLLAHRDLWVREPAPCRVENPEGLTAAELAVYEGLRANRWGEQVRLEQERVAWPAALRAISNTLGNRR